MTSFYRIRLGRDYAYLSTCLAGNFIGVDYDFAEDLTGKFPDAWRSFNAKWIPVMIDRHPEMNKIAAGLACGTLWTIGKGINQGDVILCPDAPGSYQLAEVTGDYLYVPGDVLPHRRPVRWLRAAIRAESMSEALRNSAGAPGTVRSLANFSDELQKLLAPSTRPSIIVSDATVEDPTAFAMETHMQEFLVKNWAQTELGKEYDIYEENGDKVGNHYETDTGPLDILAVRKDKKELLVVELKKGRASDAVVGQILRYMGYVSEELAEEDQTVRGAIIALEDDQRIRRALAVAPNVSFYRYQVSFKLLKC
jgi:restriction system protein